MTNQSEILIRWRLLSPYLNRQQRTLWAAAEAEVIGRSGCLMLASVTGISSQTISTRKRAIKLTRMALAGSLTPIKRSGGERRKLIEEKDPKIESSLLRILTEEIALNPTGHEKCVVGSLRNLSRRLQENNHKANPHVVARVLRKMGYTLKRPAPRKLTEEKDPEIIRALQNLLSEEIAGDPMGRQRWVRSSLRKLSKRLEEQGHRACTHVVARLLRKMGYSLQVAKKKQAGAQHPNRDDQFRYIAELKAEFLGGGLPIISIDTKKKELIGNYRRDGKTWRREPLEVDTYFASYAQCVAVPFGIYDVAQNLGYVTVGLSHNTAEFAVNCLATWWRLYGRLAYPRANRVLILADGGGGNGYNLKSWKMDLQDRLCDMFGLTVTVSHYPTGCSKWNPVEYRLFSHISMNWAGQPLRSLEVMLAFIRGTTTTTGLKVEASLDQGIYRKGRKVTERQLKELALSTHDICPRWNYTLAPRLTS
jgi:transposase